MLMEDQTTIDLFTTAKKNLLKLFELGIQYRRQNSICPIQDKTINKNLNLYTVSNFTVFQICAICPLIKKRLTVSDHTVNCRSTNKF